MIKLYAKKTIDTAIPCLTPFITNGTIISRYNRNVRGILLGERRFIAIYANPTVRIADSKNIDHASAENSDANFMRPRKPISIMLL
jgi:hypothetical protein